MMKYLNYSIIALSCLISLSSCDSKKNAAPRPSVVVSHPIVKSITPYLYETGNTVASQSIDLVARVSGFLYSNNFIDGSIVKKDDLLFVIQPQPYEDQVIEARATLSSNIAAYTYDKEEYTRQQKLYKKHATSLAELQKWESTTKQAQAAVDSARANLNNANITYSYTHILAPMDGRIGRHLVDPGNLVGNGQATELASLQQLNPMYVYFTINELDLLQLRETARKSGFTSSEIATIPIQVALQNETGFPHQGHLDFAATELDASTGSIQMRGIITNDNYDLLPGLFVRVRIALDKASDQLTVPSNALMYDQIGPYLFTVDHDNKISEIHVTTGAVVGEYTAITKGVNAHDQIVINGLQYASPGDVVTVTEQTI